MNKKQFTGKTLDEALSEAAQHFSTGKDLLCYNVINQASGGLFSRLFSRSIRIEAWIEKSVMEKDLQAAAREVVRQTLSRANSDSSSTKLSSISTSAQKEVKDTISSIKRNNKIFNKEDNVLKEHKSNSQFDMNAIRPVLTIQNVEVQKLFEKYNELFFLAFGVSRDNLEVTIGENEATVQVSNIEIEKYLSKSDKLSLAFEHIFKRIAQKQLGDVSSRISLEAGESSEKREERLIGMARTLAEKVRKTGKSVVLSSKSSHERRIIHLALDGFVGVATKSVGTGEKRRLVIYSTEKRLKNKYNIDSDTNGDKESVTHKNNRFVAAKEDQEKTSLDFKRKPYKKKFRSNKMTSKNYPERVGAVSSHDSNDEDVKQLSNKQQFFLNKEN